MSGKREDKAGDNICILSSLACRQKVVKNKSLFLKSFKIEIQLTYNIVLVLGIQHNDLIYVYIVKWLPVCYDLDI